ncbi:MAG: hypothetical protein ACYSUU_04470, partial [Planctomycetota bacterium]
MKIQVPGRCRKDSPAWIPRLHPTVRTSMKLRGKVSIAIIVPLALLLALAIRADLVDTRSRL